MSETKTKYTPGPWAVSGREVLMSVRNAGGATRMDGWKGSAFNIATPEEHQANACLIAAAPELLEALKNMLAAYGGGTKLCGHPFECVCVGDLAKAAIAKAEGKP